jgi:hypothetical protein
MTIESRRVINGTIDAIPELIDPVRKNGDSPLAGRPISRREIVQYLRKSVLLQAFAQNRFLEIIGEQIFHTTKAGSLGCGEAIKEWKLSEEHRKIGGKFGHDQMTSRCLAKA